MLSQMACGKILLQQLVHEQHIVTRQIEDLQIGRCFEQIILELGGHFGQDIQRRIVINAHLRFVLSAALLLQVECKGCQRLEQLSARW